MRVGLLGPEGTFTHETGAMAAERLGWRSPEFVTFPTGAEAVAAAARGDVDVAVVAVATSLGGEIAAESQAAAQSGLHLLDTIQRPCHYQLAAPLGATLEGVCLVRSNPKALADCAAALTRLLPGVPHAQTPSTAAAARAVAEEGRPDTAAVCTAIAAERYGLAVLAENIEDDAANWTRWLVLGRP